MNLSSILINLQRQASTLPLSRSAFCKLLLAAPFANEGRPLF
jgi:hypothetical protein